MHRRSNAHLKHSNLTGQPQHTRFAGSADSPRPGKNSTSDPTHAANDHQSGRNPDTNPSTSTGPSDSHTGPGARATPSIATDLTTPRATPTRTPRVH